jgi:hypothetical protein
MVRPEGSDHPIDAPRLGEYAIVLQQRGAAPAAREFPDVADHLASDCGLCAADLQELLAFAERELGRSGSGRGWRWRYGTTTADASRTPESGQSS